MKICKFYLTIFAWTVRASADVQEFVIEAEKKNTKYTMAQLPHTTPMDLVVKLVDAKFSAKSLDNFFCKKLDEVIMITTTLIEGVANEDKKTSLELRIAIKNAMQNMLESLSKELSKRALIEILQEIEGYRTKFSIELDNVRDTQKRFYEICNYTLVEIRKLIATIKDTEKQTSNIRDLQQGVSKNIEEKSEKPVVKQPVNNIYQIKRQFETGNLYFAGPNRSEMMQKPQQVIQKEPKAVRMKNFGKSFELNNSNDSSSSNLEIKQTSDNTGRCKNTTRCQKAGDGEAETASHAKNSRCTPDCRGSSACCNHFLICCGGCCEFLAMVCQCLAACL